MNKILKEVTNWEFPNHTYEVTPGGKIVAYRNVLTGEWTTFKKPKRFSTSRRKFITLKGKSDD